MLKQAAVGHRLTSRAPVRVSKADRRPSRKTGPKFAWTAPGVSCRPGGQVGEVEESDPLAFSPLT